MRHKWQIESFLSDKYKCLRCGAGPYTRTELHAGYKVVDGERVPIPRCIQKEITT